MTILSIMPTTALSTLLKDRAPDVNKLSELSGIDPRRLQAIAAGRETLDIPEDAFALSAALGITAPLLIGLVVVPQEEFLGICGFRSLEELIEKAKSKEDAGLTSRAIQCLTVVDSYTASIVALFHTYGNDAALAEESFRLLQSINPEVAYRRAREIVTEEAGSPGVTIEAIGNIKWIEGMKISMPPEDSQRIQKIFEEAAALRRG